MRKSVLLLASISALALGSALLLPRSIRALAQEEPGVLMLDEIDAYGNTVSVPVEFDGETYTLGDPERGIYVYDGTSARYYEDPILHPDSYPIFTSADGVFTDKIAVSVYYHTLKAYEFYTEENVGVDWTGLLGEPNPDDSPIRIYVHMNRTIMRDNAAFTYRQGSNEGYMLVGDGGWRYTLYEQGKAADIIAHEYQHGITAFMNKGLNTEGEAGAINEGVSDIFGMLVEGKDPSDEAFWWIGENGTSSGDPLRSIKDPEAFPRRNPNEEPEYVSNAKEKKVCLHRVHTDECDYGYVHSNSTIVSHVQYTAWEMCPDYFTRERIGKLWFKTLDLMTQRDAVNFSVFAEKLIEAAELLSFDESALLALKYSLFSNGFGTEPVYKVEFLNPNGELLSRVLVREGESAAAPQSPVMAPSGLSRYEFTGWDEDVNAGVYADLVILATYRTILQYSVQYLDENGNLVSSAILDLGTAPVPPAPPVRESDEKYDFVFVSWQESADAYGNKVMTPVYREELRSYEVTFICGNQKVVTSLHYGDELPDPPFASSGWYLDEECTVSAAGMTVQGAATFYAVRSGLVYYILGGVGGVLLIGGGVFLLIRKKKKAR